MERPTVFTDPIAAIEEAAFMAKTEKKTAYIIDVVDGWKISNRYNYRQKMVGEIRKEMFNDR